MYSLYWLTDAYAMRAADISRIVIIAAFVANFTRAVTLARHPDTGVYPCRLWFFCLFACSFGEAGDNCCDSAFSTHDIIG